MSTPALSPENEPAKRPAVSWQRLVIWVIVGGVGLSLVIWGLLGVIAKG